MADDSKVTVIVATFGDVHEWFDLAERAIASADAQTVVPRVIYSHRPTLADARNSGAAMATTDYLIFLDADDELDPRYVEAMLAAEGEIRRPATLGVVDGVEDNEAVMIPRRPLLEANCIVIGAMVERQRFFEVGGFDELPCLEDWDLFIRMVANGARIVDVPEAVYRVHVRSGSRNQNQALHGQIYTQIRSKYWGVTL